MYCLKCGRETQENNVFCQTCQEQMQRFPVDPEEVVRLPLTQHKTQKRPKSRRGPTPEERLEQYRLRCRIYAGLMAAFLLIALALGGCLMLLYQRTRIRPGQNYSAVPLVPATTAPVQTTQAAGPES